MVKLTPDQQQNFMREHAAADEEIPGAAMTLAWRNTARKPPSSRRCRRAG